MIHLVNRAIEGDKKAEEELFGHLLVRFELFATRKTGSIESGKEISQKASIAVLEKYRTTEFSAGFEEWAWGILKNTINSHFRQVSRESKVITSGSGDSSRGGQPEIDPELERRLLDCLKKVATVNKRFARILNLFYQGYTTDEVCRKLRLSRNNCYVMLHRGRSMLKNCLKTGEA